MELFEDLRQGTVWEVLGQEGQQGAAKEREIGCFTTAPWFVLAPRPQNVSVSRPEEPRHTMRNDFADYLKGSLICLGVWGHLIQYVGCQSQEIHYLDPVFKAIYTFHMPLFMAVSGYLSYPAIVRDELWPCLWRRFRQVVVPALCWLPIYVFAKLLMFMGETGSITDGGRAFHSWLVPFRPGPYNLWFLWAIFAATVVVATLRKFRLDRLEFFLVATVAMLFAPEGGGIYLIKFMLPFFCLGYTLAKGDQIRIPSTIPPLWVAIAWGFGIGCYWLWTPDTYVYTTRMWPAPANLHNIALRYFAGVVISIIFVQTLFWIYRRVKSPVLSLWGRRSLDIYILHILLLGIVEAFVHPGMDSPWFSWLGAPVLAGILCQVSVFAGDWLERNPWLRIVLLGRIGTGRNNAPAPEPLGGPPMKPL